MEFRVLGPLELWDQGHQVPLTGSKQRALLAVLLLHANQVVASDRLIDDLWGQELPESGATALRVRISQLRKALPQDVVQTRSPGYLIRVERDQLDLKRFEHLGEEGSRALEAGDAAEASTLLHKALMLWRGPALADFVYESFAQPAIGRLEEMRLAALELRVEADLALGRHSEVVGELEQLVMAYPLRERPRGQLMLALYRSGRQAEALDAYRAARHVLVEQLGIEPGPALRELEQSILRHDPDLRLTEKARISETASVAPERAILVVALDETQLDPLLALAESLSRHPWREVLLARLLTDDRDLGAASSRLSETRARLEERGVTARATVFTTGRLGEDFVRLAREQEIDLALLDAPPSLLNKGLPDADLIAVLTDTPCDVGLLVAKDGIRDGPVLVPFSGIEHDWAAVELAAWIARARGVPLRLAGATAVPEAGKRDASRLLSHASLAVQRGLGVAAEPLLVPPGEEGILDASDKAGLLVVGLSTRWHKEGLGPARISLARNASTPVIFVRRGARPGGLAPQTSLTRFTWSLRP